MAWSIAAVLRIALGSATVAAITAGGIAAPLIATTGVSPELMVIAVAVECQQLLLVLGGLGQVEAGCPTANILPT